MSHSVTIWRNVNVASFFAPDNGTYLSGNIEASAVVFALANVTLPRSRPWPHACAAKVRGPRRTREVAAASSLVRLDLGQTREGAQGSVPGLDKLSCQGHALNNCVPKISSLFDIFID